MFQKTFIKKYFETSQHTFLETYLFSEKKKKKIWLSRDYDYLKLNFFTIFLNLLHKTKLMKLSKQPCSTITNLIQHHNLIQLKQC